MVYTFYSDNNSSRLYPRLVHAFPVTSCLYFRILDFHGTLSISTLCDQSATLYPGLSSVSSSEQPIHLYPGLTNIFLCIMI
jgi:hypothetical protein